MKKIFIFFLCIIAIMCTGCRNNDDPYTRFKGEDLHLINGDKELFWFSGIHINDPSHVMFDDIKAQFISFKPDYVLVEGDFNKDIYANELDAKLKGESAYVTFLSSENNIEVGSIEPSFESQINQLLKKYEENDILAMYILRQIYQVQRESQNVDIDFFKYAISFTKNFLSKGFSYSDEDIDEDFIINLLEPYIDLKINDENWKQVDAGNIVYSKKGIINSIYTDVLNYRDEYSVSLIYEKLKEHNRVFIMMGADHIKNQEEALRKLFEDSN